MFKINLPNIAAAVTIAATVIYPIWNMSFTVKNNSRILTERTPMFDEIVNNQRKFETNINNLNKNSLNVHHVNGEYVHASFNEKEFKLKIK